MGAKYTEAQNKATQKYIKKSYDDIRIRVKKGEKERWQEEAAKRKKSLNQFVVDCVEDKIGM